MRDPRFSGSPRAWISDRADLGIGIAIETGLNILDNGVADSDPSPGVITFKGPVGNNFWINVSSGATKPALGNPAQPLMDLNPVDISGGAGTLVLTLSDDSFGAAGALAWTADVGGAAQFRMIYSTFCDPTNAMPPRSGCCLQSRYR